MGEISAFKMSLMLEALNRAGERLTDALIDQCPGLAGVRVDLRYVRAELMSAAVGDVAVEDPR